MIKDIFHQKKLKDWFLKIESEIMIPVYVHKDMFDSNVIIQSCLIPKELINKEFNNYENFNYDDFTPQFVKYGDGEIKYLRFNNDNDIEPLIIKFNYNGLELEEDHIELAEEFRQLFSLYYATERREYISPIDNDQLVCKFDSDYVTINKKYLKSYLKAKGKVLLLYINSQIQEKAAEKYPFNDYDFEDDNALGNIAIGNCDGSNYSLLRAKKIIHGCHLKQCNLWPFNEKHEYIDFVIGMDNNGNKIRHSCDSSTLLNYYGANPDEPHYKLSTTQNVSTSTEGES